MTESNQPPQSPHPIVTSSSFAGESSNSLNGHGSSEPTTAAELAGLQLDAEDRLAASEPLPETPSPTTSRRSIAHAPLPRTLLVAGALGFVATFTLIFSRLNSGNRPVADTPEAPEAPPEEPFDQSDVYRSQLALVDQADAQQPQAAPTPPSEPPPVAEEDPPEAPPTVATAAPSPPPRPTPAAQPEPPPRSAPAAQPEPEPIDPFERWHTLAQAGTQGEQFALVPPVEPAAPLTVTPGNTSDTSPPSNPVAPIEVAAAAGTAGFPVAIIGDNPIEGMPPPSAPSAEPAFSTPIPQPQSQESQASLLVSAPPSIPIQTAQTSSPGAQGILERRPVSGIQTEPQTIQGNTQVLQVPMGTTAAAELAVPIVASRSGETLGRFAVRLKDDLKDPYDQVALPAGTLLITDVLSIDDDSLAIQQTVVALVYEDAQGQIVQEAIAPNVLIIRGSDGGALIASLSGGGNRRNLFTDILAIGGASALAEVGSALNEGDLFTSTASSSDGDETETTTTTVRDSDDPNVLGAVMEGFFESTADRLQGEIEDDRDNDEDLDPVLTVTQGQDLQVFVNGILNIRR
ncbi:MAG: hypothetical protein F6J95_030880 [Leptolyngbya sp. SIO1E4]|nr:hypothetical protein [Leptolyngbya sp. SIO1E4]